LRALDAMALGSAFAAIALRSVAASASNAARCGRSGSAVNRSPTEAENSLIS